MDRAEEAGEVIAPAYSIRDFEDTGVVLATLARTPDGVPIVPAVGDTLLLNGTAYIVQRVIHHYEGLAGGFTGITVAVQELSAYWRQRELDRLAAKRIIRGRATRADLERAGR